MYIAMTLYLMWISQSFNSFVNEVLVFDPILFLDTFRNLLVIDWDLSKSLLIYFRKKGIAVDMGEDFREINSITSLGTHGFLKNYPCQSICTDPDPLTHFIYGVSASYPDAFDGIIRISIRLYCIHGLVQSLADENITWNIQVDVTAQYNI